MQSGTIHARPIIAVFVAVGLAITAVPAAAGVIGCIGEARIAIREPFFLGWMAVGVLSVVLLFAPFVIIVAAMAQYGYRPCASWHGGKARFRSWA